MFLLDTHTLIWYLSGDKILSANAKSAIDNPQNTKFVSIASIWEIAIKISLGKLSLAVNLEEFVEAILESQINIIDIRINHLINLSKLEYIHRDPFDRIMIAQSLENNLIMITKDSNIKKYNVKTLW